MHIASIKIHLNDKEIDDYTRMQLMMQLYKEQIDADVRQYILAAYDITDEWDYRKDSDGCTMVSEVHSPAGTKFPPCVMHDYLRNVLVSKGIMPINNCDYLFYKAQWQFGMNRLRAGARAIFVRTIAWWLWFRWS